MMPRLRHALAALHLREARLRTGRCPFCGVTVYVRLHAGDGGVRCLRCAAGPVHLALGRALRDEVPDLAARDACEFSAYGPLVAWLRRRARSLATSEFVEGARPGEIRDGTRCEDMQCLGYADASFDLVTHTEVLEHVPDDALALRELRRVLRPGGLMLFSVPAHDGPQTVERARRHADGRIEHLLQPVYHSDPRRPEGILAFRDYGDDLLDRLHAAGFAGSAWLRSGAAAPWSEPRALVMARA